MLTAKRSGRKWRVMDDTGAVVYECNSKAEADAYIAEQDSKAMAERAELRQQFAELFDVTDAEYTGVMLALYPPADLAAQWAAIDGATQPAEQLHVTLAYLGKTDGLRDEQIAGAILAARNVAMSEEPLAAKINGVGRFNASESSDGQDVIYAVVDAPKLLKLRDHACELLEQFDAEPDDNHGYTPHMTLAYIEAGAPSPIQTLPTVEFVFDRITIAVGGKTVSFPFVEVEDEIERMNKMRYGMYGESELADLCADGQTWRLFNEVSFAEPPAWMPYLPKPGEFTHQAYGKISITPERNRRFVDNFKAGVYQSRLPVDAEHQTKLSGATGWITDMRLNEDGSVDAKVEWTDRGVAMIKADRFKYVSPEWYSTWQDPATEKQYEDVAIGAALTTRPFFKESALRPLVANEHGIDAPTVATGNTDSIDIVENKEQVNMAEDTKAKTEQPQVTVQQFSELEQKFSELNQRYAAAEEARTEAINRAQKFQEALDAANKRVATLESAAQRQRFGELVSKWYGKTEDNVQTLIDLAEAFGEGTDKFNAFVAQQNAIAERLNSSEAFKEIGHNKQTPEAQTATQKYKEAVGKLVADGAKYIEAADRVSKEQPQLYIEYMNEIRGR